MVSLEGVGVGGGQRTDRTSNTIDLQIPVKNVSEAVLSNGINFYLTGFRMNTQTQ